MTDRLTRSAEFTFGQSGVVTHEPKKAGELSGATPETGGGCRFRESILLGETEMTLSEVRANVIPHMEQKMGFVGQNYDVMRKNCNSFSDELAKIMFNSKKSVIPGWVNRAAKIGSAFSGFMPTANRPEVQGEQQPYEQKPSFQAFAGEGRALGSRASEANQQLQGQQQNQNQQKGSWFSRWFGRGSGGCDEGSGAGVSGNVLKKADDDDVPQQQQQHQQQQQETEEQRRQRVLQATMNRLGNRANDNVNK